MKKFIRRHGVAIFYLFAISIFVSLGFFVGSLCRELDSRQKEQEQLPEASVCPDAEIIIDELPEAEEAPEQLPVVMYVKATAYCPCEKCCGKSDGITATGVKAKSCRTLAVDPDTIPYGSIVIIDGQEYVAEDCGGAIQGNRVDIFFDTHQEALEYGVRETVAYVYFPEGAWEG